MIPENFELVMAVLVASFFLHHIYMAFSVGAARKKYGVKYPDLYASTANCSKEEDIKVFNCVQRGHQNSLEMQPIFLALLITAGLQHPITAAAAGVVFLVGRFAYFTGYSTGSPGKRQLGVFYVPALLTLIGILVKCFVVYVQAKLL